MQYSRKDYSIPGMYLNMATIEVTLNDASSIEDIVTRALSHNDLSECECDCVCSGLITVTIMIAATEKCSIIFQHRDTRPLQTIE